MAGLISRTGTMRNIALALSGGGFRAAGFSLGSLSYLNSISFDGKPLLENVKFIGSTSGGSITSLLYSAGICRREEFSTIYRRLFNAIEGEDLLIKVFKVLNDDKVWKLLPHKSRNLINAFSIAYDSMLYSGETFNIFSNEIVNTHLEDICVNATEFSNGISFRFQSQHPDQSFPRGRVGNNYIFFKRNAISIANQLKLADLLACSTCFPGGFEPFIFPDDFTHKHLSIKELSEAVVFKENPFTLPTNPNDLVVDKDFDAVKNRFGIMDGGISDNQAIDSVLLANDRRRKAELPEFDLIIVTDVTSYFIDAYTLPIAKKGNESLFTVNKAVNGLLIFGLLFLLLSIISFFSGWTLWIYLFLFPSTVSLLIYFFIQAELKKVKSGTAKTHNTWATVLFRYGGYFMDLRYAVLRQVLLSRLKSLFILADDIFLKQIRRLYYNKLYNDPELKKIVISNAIYDLSNVKQKAVDDTEVVKVMGFNNLDGKGESRIAGPGQSLIAVAEKARLMPTTLWFDEYQTLANTKAAIIATGQFTTCFNLLKYIGRLEKRLLEEENGLQPLNAEITALKLDLEADWAKFIADPYFLYNKEGEKISGFTAIHA